MMKHLLSIALLMMPAAALQGQQLRLESLDKLGAKATNTINVNLDSSLLRLASKFLSSGDADEIQIKKLVAGLRGIYVRNFEFARTGQYLDSDVEAIRGQLRDRNWKHIVEVRGRDNADVCVRQEGDAITGLAVLYSEPTELTVVYIDGPIDLDGLSKLEGNFGIPDDLRNKVERKSK